MKRARRWAAANRAGGVGKSTTCVNLGAALASRGKKVVIVDYDAQHNATTAIGIRDASHPSFPAVTVYQAFREPHLTPQAIGPSTVAGVDLVYGNPEMESIEFHLIADADPEMAIKARQMIEEIEALDIYDVILFDCPGAINIATRNALLAVDVVIMPVQAHFRAFEARGRLLTEVSKLIERKTMKKPPRFVAFINLLDERARSAKELRDLLLEDVAGNAKVASEVQVTALTHIVDGERQLIAVHSSQTIPDSYGMNQSIFAYAPGTRATVEFMQLADAMEALELEAVRG